MSGAPSAAAPGGVPRVGGGGSQGVSPPHSPPPQGLSRRDSPGPAPTGSSPPGSPPPPRGSVPSWRPCCRRRRGAPSAAAPRAAFSRARGAGTGRDVTPGASLESGRAPPRRVLAPILARCCPRASPSPPPLLLVIPSPVSPTVSPTVPPGAATALPGDPPVLPPHTPVSPVTPSVTPVSLWGSHPHPHK